jgi:hypothetical protein
MSTDSPTLLTAADAKDLLDYYQSKGSFVPNPLIPFLLDLASGKTECRVVGAVPADVETALALVNRLTFRAADAGSTTVSWEDLRTIRANLEELQRLRDEEIAPLADLLMDSFGGPSTSESACEMACRLLRGRVVPHKEGCDGGEFTCICSYATGRVVGGKDVADRAEYEAWYASRGWSQPIDGAWADFGWKVWQAAVERAAPLHDLAVGRDGLQHDASDSRSSPPSLPLTGGKKP